MYKFFNICLSLAAHICQMTQDYAQTVKVWGEKEVMKIDLTYAEMEIEFSSFI